MRKTAQSRAVANLHATSFKKYTSSVYSGQPPEPWQPAAKENRPIGAKRGNAANPII